MHTLKRNRSSIFHLVVQLDNKKWTNLIDSLIKQGVLYSPNVIKAMRAVPRAKFLPSDMQSYSAADTPLPIGFGQTISAPHSLSCVLD
jgi:protein-L-isoaspartate(D-aspartate) O-methyltransferase